MNSQIIQVCPEAYRARINGKSPKVFSHAIIMIAVVEIAI